MSTSTAASVRCPQCSAHLRAGSEWCTLCYADLRPKPEPVSAPEPVATASANASVAPEAVAEVAASSAAKPRGKHAKHASDPPVFGQATQVVAEDEVEALANQMLAELAATKDADALASLTGAIDTKGKRVVLMIGGAVGGMCLLFVLMALLGTLV